MEGLDGAREFGALGVSLGLGMLVGLQRERSKALVAGIRTFPLVSVLGTLCAMLSENAGAWVIPAGLVAIMGAAAIANFSGQPEERGTGATTEIAMAVMFAVGALLWFKPWSLGVVMSGAVVVLLHAKTFLHRFADAIVEGDFRAIMQFVLISLVVLPVLPNEAYDRFGVLNPRHIWMMVVLVVGISLGGYLAYKAVGDRGGAVLGGVLGGLISSTATTASFSRRAAENPAAVPQAVFVVLLATAVMYVRVLVEIAAVAPAAFWRLAPPIGVLMVLTVGLAAGQYVYHRIGSARPVTPRNPTELRLALVFGAVYTVVLLATAVGREYFGQAGAYVVAGIAGLTDMDAVTLSNAQTAVGGAGADQAGRAILIGGASNLFFKWLLAWSLGGTLLAWRLGIAFGVKLIAIGAIIVLWPWW